MKICSIVGARPQFIKAAVVSRAVREVAQEVLVHTGQHYDDGMSARFFRELEIPQPDYDLEVGSHSHGVQKEAYLVGVPCVTLRDETEWVETVEAGWNILTGADREKIVETVRTFRPPSVRPDLFGAGRAAARIAGLIAG